jgi:hypothetical protein
MAGLHPAINPRLPEITVEPGDDDYR